jgi:23S rRNA pseudouridine1911/1915/1917 synthase
MAAAAMGEEEVFTHHVPPEQARMRVDVALTQSFPQKSRAKIQRAIGGGGVRSGGRPLRAGERLRGGELLEIFWGPEPPRLAPPEPRTADLDLIYEDECIVAVAKPAGVIVHGAENSVGESLVEVLLAHTAGALSRCGDPLRPGVVHRLDRDTTGVLLFAKTDAAHRALAEQFALRSVQKTYEALAHAVPSRLSGTASGAIGRDPRRRTRMAVVPRGGRAASTGWRAVPCREKNFTHFTLHPQGGRTHQIRVHLSAMGHPILGDSLYGCPPHAVQAPRVMLHARILSILHPLSRCPLSLKAPLPIDMAQLLRWGGLPLPG